MRKQDGFAAIEAVLVVVILGIIGGTGYFVWQAKQSTDKSLADTANSQPALQKHTADTKPVTATNAARDTYLHIKEWGVKIAFTDIDKVNYAYSKEGFEGDFGQVDSSISIIVDKKYYQNKDCNPAVGLQRMKTINDFGSESNLPHIGAYYYSGPGSPFNCENDTDNALNARIRAEYGKVVAE